MRLSPRPFVLLLTALLCLGQAVAEEPRSEPVAGFSLKDFVGQEWSLEEAAEKKVVAVAFLGIECPLVKLYAGRLEKLQQDYAERGVLVIGVNSNQQDSLAEMAAFARRHELTFPLLKDPGNRVADQFGAERTPEVFLLDADRRVRYRGRIDDQYTYGRERPRPTENFLRDAIDDLLAGREVKTARTETVGCHIGRLLKPQADSEVTYSNQIARLLQKRCVECHRKGEIGPFPLTSYEETVGWAEMILEVALERRMPPWHASPDHGDFLNSSRLSDEELDLLEKWVDAGAAEGDPGQQPKPRQFTAGWRIGEPDLVVWMTEKEDQTFKVPARGTVPYKYFVVDPGLKQDTWVQAAECQPGNRSVVHHIIVGIRDGGSRGQVHGRRSEWLAATAPGAIPMQLPPGHAKLIPAGSKLIFQMHYTPNGTAQEDRSCVGFKFADPKTVRHRVATHQAANPRFRIPPGDSNHEVRSSYTFRKDGVLLSLFPHMHLRGKSFRYEAEFPDGRREVLLDVPAYDFNWQNAYLLKEPMRMPAGTRLRCTAHYDNSEDNLANPDPTKTVRWGDQTWDEMMIGYFDLYDPSPLGRTHVFTSRAEQIDSAALVEPARGALASDEAFEKFGAAVRETMPQVDRIDLIVIRDGQLQVERLAQPRSVLRQLGAKIKIGVEGMALPKYAAADEHRVHSDLAKVAGADIRFMRRAMNASAHFPLQYDGHPAVLSFWSSEAGAFPEAAETLLKRAAAAAR